MAATNVMEAFREILVSDSTYAAITTKVFPVEVNQTEALPYAVYLVDDITVNESKQTVSRLDEVDFLLIHNAATFSQAYAMLRAAREALEKYDGTVGNVIIQDIVYKGDEFMYSKEVGKRRTYFYQHSFTVYHQKN